MTKLLKDYLLEQIRKGTNAVNEVWTATKQNTPEESICNSIIQNLNALEMLIELIKTKN